MNPRDEELKKRVEQMSDEDIRELMTRLAPGRVKIAQNELAKRERNHDLNQQQLANANSQKDIQLKEDANALAQRANQTANKSFWVAIVALLISIMVPLFKWYFTNNS